MPHRFNAAPPQDPAGALPRALAGHLVELGTNPDHLSHEALAADLTNRMIPGVIVTPGAVGTPVELQHAGFTYCK